MLEILTRLLFSFIVNEVVDAKFKTRNRIPSVSLQILSVIFYFFFHAIINFNQRGVDSVKRALKLIRIETV